jgi:hypothetical protein
MIKITLPVLLLASIVLPASARAQVVCALGATVTPYNPTADAPPSELAQSELNKIQKLLCPKGCGSVHLFQNATAPNLAVVAFGTGISKIVYSPDFLNGIHATYGADASFGVLAHAFGHHLDLTAPPASWMNGAWNSERRADALAGCALGRAALRPEGLQAALVVLASHPSAADNGLKQRWLAVRAGYAQCGGGRKLPEISALKLTKAAEKAGLAAPAIAAVVATPNSRGGCAANADCRNGRVCDDGQCRLPSGPKKCGKDTDCPEPGECNAGGHCEDPRNREAAKDEAPPPAESEERHPMTSAPAPAPGSDPAECGKGCDEKRETCVATANGEFKQCFAPVEAESSYKACTCPNWPRENLDCYRVCAAAFEKAKVCSTENKIVECKAEGARCRATCP